MSAPSLTHSQARELMSAQVEPKDYNLVRIGAALYLAQARLDGDLLQMEIIARVLD